uniref:Uncharacterized protein n=1 Tax=Knipowitschia caucasica TaxID=637954 RepID=A0AAV2KT70_KNICA
MSSANHKSDFLTRTAAPEQKKCHRALAEARQLFKVPCETSSRRRRSSICLQELSIDRASIFNGMENTSEKEEKAKDNGLVHQPDKGQDLVGGIGQSGELQMWRTAGIFPLS